MGRSTGGAVLEALGALLVVLLALSIVGTVVSVVVGLVATAVSVIATLAVVAVFVLATVGLFSLVRDDGEADRGRETSRRGRGRGRDRGGGRNRNRGADGRGPDRNPERRLRERYLAGEIDEVEFERRLERLLDGPDEDRLGGPGSTDANRGRLRDRLRDRLRER